MVFYLCKYCTRRIGCDMYEDFYDVEWEAPKILENCSYFNPVPAIDIMMEIKEKETIPLTETLSWMKTPWKFETIEHEDGSVDITYTIDSVKWKAMQEVIKKYKDRER